MTHGTKAQQTVTRLRSRLQHSPWSCSCCVLYFGALSMAVRRIDLQHNPSKRYRRCTIRTTAAHQHSTADSSGGQQGWAWWVGGGGQAWPVAYALCSWDSQGCCDGMLTPSLVAEGVLKAADGLLGPTHVPTLHFCQAGLVAQCYLYGQQLQSQRSTPL